MSGSGRSGRGEDKGKSARKIPRAPRGTRRDRSCKSSQPVTAPVRARRGPSGEGCRARRSGGSGFFGAWPVLGDEILLHGGRHGVPSALREQFDQDALRLGAALARLGAPLVLRRGPVHQIFNTGAEPMEILGVFGATPVATRLPDGSSATREFIRHGGAVAVVPLLDEGPDPRLVLVRQYRYPTAKVLLEIPAGKRDPGEDQLVCAQRELREETGYVAREWAYGGEIHNAAAYSSESIWIWFARGLVPGPARPDSGLRSPEFSLGHRATRQNAMRALR